MFKLHTKLIEFLIMSLFFCKRIFLCLLICSNLPHDYGTMHEKNLAIDIQNSKNLTLCNKTDCNNECLIVQFVMTKSNHLPRNDYVLFIRNHYLLKRRRILIQTHITMKNSTNTMGNFTQRHNVNANLNYLKICIAQINISKVCNLLKWARIILGALIEGRVW